MPLPQIKQNPELPKLATGGEGPCEDSPWVPPLLLLCSGGAGHRTPSPEPSCLALARGSGVREAEQMQTLLNLDALPSQTTARLLSSLGPFTFAHFPVGATAGPLPLPKASPKKEKYREAPGSTHLSPLCKMAL